MNSSGTVSRYIVARRLFGHAPWIVLLAVVLATYWTVLVGLARDWINDPNYHHGLLIPMVSGFLLWGKRRALLDQTPEPSNSGVLGLLLAGALLILGKAGAEVFTQRVSFLLLLASLTLFLLGWRHLKLVGFPIAFMLLAIPLPYVIYYGLTGPLQNLAAKCAVWAMRSMGVQVVAQGNMVHLPQTSLEVAEACSGIRSLYAFLAVGALVAHATPIPWGARIFVFLATIPLSVAGNAVRVLGTGLGVYLIGPEAASGTVHELFGIFVFVVCLGVFLIIKKVASKTWSSESPSPL